jgi:hypothetical protein
MANLRIRLLQDAFSVPGLLEARFGISNLDDCVEVGIAGVSVDAASSYASGLHMSPGHDPLGIVPILDPGENRQLGIVAAGPTLPVDQLRFQA